ncbi:MAG TPA: hypothetical protein VFY74_04535 [Methyloceanibacter sp.]|jgi:hypothetical protein|nr:hypothetical protein [Methyloceanibacter sp.]
MDMFGPNPNRARVSLETTRLKLPPVELTESPTPLKLLGSQAAEADEADRGATDLLIRGLVDRLPKPNAVWSLEERARWLRTAASVFGLVYKDSDGEQREIGVVCANRDPAVGQGLSPGTARESD